MSSEFFSYLLLFDDTKVTRQKVVERIDAMSEIVNWKAFMPSGIIVVSSIDADELARGIREHQDSKYTFILTKLTSAKNGWLPTSVWDFMNQPKPVGQAE